jgi:lipoprotein-anchoring transpeptidase ErfK/SrfK
MLILYFLLGSLLFLSPLAQAKDKEEVIQKTDILFNTEAKETPKAKKPLPQKVAPQQTVAPSPAKESTTKTKEPVAPSQGTVPAPAPSSTPSQVKEKTTDTKTPAQPPISSLVVSRPAEAPASDVKPATAPVGPPEAKKEVPPIPSTQVMTVSNKAGQPSLQEILQQAYECLQKDRKYEARSLYTQALFQETSEERRQIIRKHLEELNSALLFSPTPGPDFLTYQVQAGDNLTKIAKKYNTTPELLARLNRKSSTLLRIGEPLRILKGKISLLVDKSDFRLTLLLDGNYLRQYPIGLGKNDKTPEGKFVIETKMKEPTWFAPEGKIYPYGSPENILGTRWISFQNQPGLTGYGIHGTAEPESIGTESSNGCVRMYNQDVEELYNYVTAGAEVIIQR